MYHMVLVYDMVMPRAMRVIRDVYAMSFTWPGLVRCLWVFIKNHSQPIGGTEEEDFPQPSIPFSSFRSAIKNFENFGFSFDVKKTTFHSIVTSAHRLCFCPSFPRRGRGKGVAYLEFNFLLELTYNNDNQMFCLKGWVFCLLACLTPQSTVFKIGTWKAQVFPM